MVPVWKRRWLWCVRHCRLQGSSHDILGSHVLCPPHLPWGSLVLVLQAFPKSLALLCSSPQPGSASPPFNLSCFVTVAFLRKAPGCLIWVFKLTRFLLALRSQSNSFDFLPTLAPHLGPSRVSQKSSQTFDAGVPPFISGQCASPPSFACVLDQPEERRFFLCTDLIAARRSGDERPLSVQKQMRGRPRLCAGSSISKESLWQLGCWACGGTVGTEDASECPH